MNLKPVKDILPMDSLPGRQRGAREFGLVSKFQPDVRPEGEVDGLMEVLLTLSVSLRLSAL